MSMRSPSATAVRRVKAVRAHAPSVRVEVLPNAIPMPRPGRVGGFTFIEVVFCMAIFAVGFLAVAMMLPAGAVIQKELEARADATIIGNNSLQVLKAQGVQALTWGWIERLGGNATYQANTYWNWGALPGCTTSLTALAAAFPTAGTSTYAMTDMEQASDARRHYVKTTAGTLVYTPTVQLGAAVGWAPKFNNYWDTNGVSGDLYGWTWWWNFSSNGGNWYSAMGPWYLGDEGDHTAWGMGIIHCYKNRPIPGVTAGVFAQGDFSYPSTVFDLSRRKYFSHIQVANRNTSQGPGQPSNHDPAFDDFRIMAMTVARPDDLSIATWNPAVKGWPEQVEWDLALSDQIQDPTVGNPTRHRGTPDAATIVGPHFRMSNTGVDFRSQTGGSPANGNPGERGWVGRFNSRMKYWSNLGMTNRMWDYPAAGCNYFYGYPVRDSTQTVYDWRGAYITPVPQDVLAIVYDKSKDLLLLRYPQAFAKTPDTSQGANPRLDSSVFPTGADWVDRRLKVGDPLITLTGGYTFRVKTVLDEVAAGITLPASRGLNAAGSAGMDWSDGTYQLIQVTPSLSTIQMNDNVYDNSTDWPSGPDGGGGYLYRVIIGTPPITGGPNALQSVVEVPAGGLTAGGVMLPYADLAN